MSSERGHPTPTASTLRRKDAPRSLMQFSVKSNIAQFRRMMRKEQRSQLPFATARALTMTGKDAKAHVEQQMGKVFDQPTPFTQRGVAALPATKAKLYSRVVIKDAQAKYLGIQEEVIRDFDVFLAPAPQRHFASQEA
jgi:hypothetical protein